MKKNPGRRERRAVARANRHTVGRVKAKQNEFKMKLAAKRGSK